MPNMSMYLGEIASLVGGSLHGDAALTITGAAILRDAHEGDITLADRQYLNQLADSTASAVLVPPNMTPSGKPFVVVDDVHASFAKIIERFRPSTFNRTAGVSAAAYVSDSARLAVHVTVHPGATIGDDVEVGEGTVIHPGVRILDGSRIGRDVTLFPNVVIYDRCVIGNRVTIHGGAVIGAYGFGYQFRQGRHERSAQLGYVEIGDDVEIGANTTIDRGTYGATVIGEGTKIDNQVMVAHNCRLGRHNLICSLVGIAGSCTTGDYVVMAGQVGLRDHITIGDRVILGAKSGVMHSITEPGTWVGIPATPEREQMVKQASLSKLPDMRKEFKVLQRQVEELKTALAENASRSLDLKKCG
jgi:UDP-3-O-[3-hydroxymyristoyl] glucosamine N-acyltransferase